MFQNKSSPTSFPITGYQYQVQFKNNNYTVGQKLRTCFNLKMLVNK